MIVALRHVEAALARCAARAAHLKGIRDKLLKRTTVSCDKCKVAHPIETLRYIQTHWYTEPHGCTGGDYWNQGEGNWDCPGCGQRNRLYKQPEIEKLKALSVTSGIATAITRGTAPSANRGEFEVHVHF